MKRFIDFIQVTLNKTINYSLLGVYQNIIIIALYAVIVGVPNVYIFIDLILSVIEKEGSIKIISIFADVLGIFSLTMTSVMFFHKRRQYTTKKNNFRVAYLAEIQSLDTVFNNVDIDLTDEEFFTYSFNKLLPTYIDLYDTFESFVPFGKKFYLHLSYFIGKHYFNKEYERIFVYFLVFQEKSKFHKEYIKSISDQDFFTGDSDYCKAMKLYHHSTLHPKMDISLFDPGEHYNQKEELEELYRNIISTENSEYTKLFEKLRSEELKSSLLEHIVDETYSIVSQQSSKETLINGACLLIKNEENFDSWWGKLDKQIKERMTNDKKSTAEEIKNFSLKNEMAKKLFGGTFKQPFSTAVKEDPYFSQFLNYNNRAPVYVVQADELPLTYRQKPISYIENVIKKSAEKKQKKLIQKIRENYGELNHLNKTLIFDYELIPFDIFAMKVKARAKSTPRFIEKYHLKSFIETEKRGQFIEAHILQIKKVLSKVSPISLVVNSVSKVKILNLKEIEIQFINELAKAKNEKIIYEGLTNINAAENKKKKIIDVLYRISKSKNKGLTQADCKLIVSEIHKNAKFILKKLTAKS